MRKYILLLSILSIALSGCNIVLRHIYGVKNPKFENDKSVMEFQNEIGFSEFPNLGVSFETWKSKNFINSNDIFVFKSNGKYIPYKDPLKPNCSGPAEVFLAQLNRSRVYDYSDEFTLKTFLELMEGHNCESVNFSQSDSVDFYVFMTYAKFLGKKLHKKYNATWLEALKDNKQIKFQLILINQDLKACWTQEQKDWFEKRK